MLVGVVLARPKIYSGPCICNYELRPADGHVMSRPSSTTCEA